MAGQSLDRGWLIAPLLNLFQQPLQRLLQAFQSFFRIVASDLGIRANARSDFPFAEQVTHGYAPIRRRFHGEFVVVSVLIDYYPHVSRPFNEPVF
jgi:hypothetical protein